WGNGTFASDTNVTFTGSAGTYTISGKHLYTDEDGFSSPIRLRVLHEGTTSNTGNVTLALTDPQIHNLTGGFTFTASEGTAPAAPRLAPFPDPADPNSNVDTPARHSAVHVDWGNGTFVNADPNVTVTGSAGTFTVKGTHLYADEDGFASPIRVRVTHETNPSL